MKNLKVPFVLWMMTFLVTVTLYAQADSVQIVGSKNGPASYHLILKKQGSSILMRWAPTQAGIWLNGLKGFIQIERISFESFQKFKNATTEVLAQNLGPWSKSRFEEQIKLHPENRYLPIAQDLIYGDWETVKKKQELTMGTILASREELMHKYSAALFIADMDLLAAEALGLHFKDINPPAKKYVLYRLTAYDGKKMPLTAQALYNPNFNPTIVPNIDQVAEEDGYIRLSWDRTEHEKYFTAYYVERSADGKSFSRIHQLPYINAVDQKESMGIPPITYLATAENGQLHHYRILGVDAFGQLSEPSKTVQASAKDKTPPPAPQRIEAVWKNSQFVEIQWGQDSLVPDLQGYALSKSLHPEGPFVQITPPLPASSRHFKDQNPDPVNGMYYQVCALDRSGNSNCSSPVYAFFNDKTPPPVPKGLAGNIDTNGIVRLHWNLGTAPDLSGYHVYAANGPNQVFTRLNKAPVKDTLWADTLSLKSLTEKIYYRITAVDLRSNTSPFSEILPLAKPDKIPPSAPVFTGYRETGLGQGIELNWINSNSKDLVHHILLRRTHGAVWQEVAKMSRGEKKFQDLSLQPKTNYEYQIVAVDDAGNRTSCPVNLFVQTNAKPIVLNPLQISSKTTGGVSIQLDLQKFTEPVAQIIIYKSINNSEFKLWKSMPYTEKIELNDDSMNHHYKYRLVYQDGRKSQYSPETVLKKE